MTRDEEVKYAFAELDQTFYDALNALMEKVDARARAEEREACAKLCDDLVADGMRGTPEWNSGVLNCVAAIRTKGEKL
jgi:hypothetical protein